MRTISTISFLSSAACLAVAAPLLAQGHADEDINVGRSGAGRLVAEFDFSALLEAFPVGGLFTGWASDEPGFFALPADEPAEDLFTLEPGASVALEITAISAALRGNPLTDDLDQAGEQTLLGDHLLHVHINWLIDDTYPAFDPLQTEWDVSFKLIDLGTTNYAESAIYTLRYAPVPEPSTLALLGLSGMLLLRGAGGSRRVRRQVARALAEGMVTP